MAQARIGQSVLSPALSTNFKSYGNSTAYKIGSGIPHSRGVPCKRRDTSAGIGRITPHGLVPEREGVSVPQASVSSGEPSVAGETLVTRLRRLDTLLAGDGPDMEAQAVKEVDTFRSEGLLRGFGGAAQVPKRQYTLEELRLNKIEPEKLLSPKDNTLNGVRNIVQGAAAAGLAAAFFGFHWTGGQLLAAVAAALFTLTLDQVANGGGFEALAIDAAGRAINPEYGRRVAFHEAGHFLIAYLVGILPRRYTLSSLDAFRKYGALNVQAGTQFCDAAFQREVAKGGLSSTSLDRFTCVALAGVATEYISFGQAEGGLNDVMQLDGLLRALQFSQKKADDQIRWAVLNVVMLLRRHVKTHRRLADAMSAGKSVADCILVIEESLSKLPDKEI